ncbi:MAG: AMP-binding protein [Actinomycetes bacterium]
MRVPLTVSDFLDRAAAVYPERPGVVDEPGTLGSLGALTNDRFHRRARAVAAGLDALGVGEGDRVAVVSHNSARLLEMLFAVPAYGRICVPVNFRLNADEVSYIVEHSGASVLLLDPELDESLSGVGAKHRMLLGPESDEALLRFDTEPRPWSDPDEDATATLNYTSGTTARPKGVQLTHRNVWLNATVFGLHTGVREDDVYLHTLPMFHCNGWGMPYVLAGMGVPQVVLRKVDGTEILRRIDEHGVTFMCGAPAVWNAVLKAAEQWQGEIPGRDRVRLICAGAPPPSSLIQRVESDLGWEFGQIYGLTETAPLLTVNRPRAEEAAFPEEERAKRRSRAGAPALGVQLDISEAGEVKARSNHCLAGYWENPEASEAVLVDGWFHTGDGGDIDEEGYLVISDRKKDVIISGGENVSSIEVEDRLFSHPAVAECAVIGVPHAKWGETVMAVVVLVDGGQADEAELIEHCRAGLAHYKCPTSVDVVEAIPRTATGKVQKFRLREPYWAGRDRRVN